jgi:hypothetical protein
MSGNDVLFGSTTSPHLGHENILEIGLKYFSKTILMTMKIPMMIKKIQNHGQRITKKTQSRYRNNYRNIFAMMDNRFDNGSLSFFGCVAKSMANLKNH